MRRSPPRLPRPGLAACGGDRRAPSGPRPPPPPRPPRRRSRRGSRSGVAPPRSPGPPGSRPRSPTDAAAGDVPVRALVPRGPPSTAAGTPRRRRATRSWWRTSSGAAIPSAPPRPPGLAPLRHASVAALFAVDHPAEAGVLSIQVVADVTGDGSPDALVKELTGGSGACGTWRVIDLARAADLGEGRLCDAQVAPSTDPGGADPDRGGLQARRLALLPQRYPHDRPVLRRRRPVDRGLAEGHPAERTEARGARRTDPP